MPVALRSLLAAGIMLAMAFTLSCSSPDDGSNFEYGSLSYQGKTYKTIKIGEQTWMAENLNYEADGSECYDNKPANCQKYGRLYDWNTALTVCPPDWHLPSDAEWARLMNFVGTDPGIKLKAKNGWEKYDYNKGTDDYGFSALPGGADYSGSGFNEVGYYGNFWSATENNYSYAYLQRMGYNSAYVNHYDEDKTSLLSVRCLQD